MSNNTSQFQLLRQRQFLPFFATQALGAFNDNLFKNALLLFIAFSGLVSSDQAALYTNLAAGLFILPFFLFSPIAGQIADRQEKSGLIRQIKLIEVAIMGLAAAALFFDSITVLLGLLFLMGLQSALFGPVKFALLPQHLKDEDLVGGNALVETGTFLAILGGTILAGILFEMEQAKPFIAVGLVFLAVFGYFTSRFIPEGKANDPELVINWNPVSEIKNTIQKARQTRSVYLSILAISWFWFLGASYLTQFPTFARDYLGGNTQIVTLLLTLFSLGVGLGSLLCERLSGHKIELGIVPIGSLGMSVFGIDLFFACQQIDVTANMTAMEFLAASDNWRLMFDIAMISAFGGIYVVPLQTLVQHRSDDKSRAQIIAANNVLNALLMVASAVVSIILLSTLKVSLPEYFLILALANVVVATFVYQQVPEFFLRFCMWMLSHTMYRVTHTDMDKIPDEGAAVLVCNHVSYVDALILAGCHHRPTRFVMDKSIAEMKGLKGLFKMAKTIPICSPKRDAKTYEKAFEKIKEELNAGHLICIFPEGKLTKTGEIDEFKKGIERIIGDTPVPVIPMALEGLWGSFFSHKDGHALTTRPRRFWSRVRVVAGDPVRPDHVRASDLEAKVKHLYKELSEH